MLRLAFLAHTDALGAGNAFRHKGQIHHERYVQVDPSAGFSPTRQQRAPRSERHRGVVCAKCGPLRAACRARRVAGCHGVQTLMFNGHRVHHVTMLGRIPLDFHSCNLTLSESCHICSILLGRLQPHTRFQETEPLASPLTHALPPPWAPPPMPSDADFQ